jgi:hypothetical protein
MVSNCQFEAAKRLGGDVSKTTATYEGQRTDGTHAVNGTIRMRGRTSNFQCTFARNGALLRFWTNAPQAAAPQEPTTTTQRITLTGGSSGTEISAQLSPGSSIRYVLRAKSGVFLHTRVATNAPQVYYQIFNPDNSFLLEQMTSAKEYRGQLWQTGDHVIEVINRGNRSASFNIMIGLGGSVSATPGPAEQACLRAVAKENNNADVVLLRSEFSQAGTTVIVGVGPQRAPWECIAYSDGSTSRPMSLTNEGAL